MNHTLEVDSIQLGFGGNRILSDIYLKCETGKITGLLGRNGQGKSCLMKIIFGCLKCESSIRIDKLFIKPGFRRAKNVHYLPQFNFIPKSLPLKRVFQDFELEYSNFLNLFPEFIGRQNIILNSMSGGERRLIELYVILKSQTRFAVVYPGEARSAD